MKQQEIWPTEKSLTCTCSECGKYAECVWYEGNPARYGDARRFIGAFCSDECAEVSGKYKAV